MTLKTTVFAAMPSASTKVAVAVTTGAARLDRMANRRSVQTAVNSQTPNVSRGRAINHSLLGAATPRFTTWDSWPERLKVGSGPATPTIKPVHWRHRTCETTVSMNRGRL